MCDTGPVNTILNIVDDVVDLSFSDDDVRNVIRGACAMFNHTADQNPDDNTIEMVDINDVFSALNW